MSGSMRSRNTVERKKLKAYLRERYGPNCWYCETELDFSNPKDECYATFEHLLEDAQGGKSNRENLRLSCKYCNQAVRGMTVEQKHIYRKKCKHGSTRHSFQRAPTLGKGYVRYYSRGVSKR